jgi:predicted dehydrogenase
MSEPVTVGVIGVGYLGRYHAEKYAALAETELVGVADQDRDQARKVAHAVHTRDFVDYRDLLPHVAAVSVAVPTSQHYAVVRDCLAASWCTCPGTAASSSWWATWSASTPPWKSSKGG